MTTREIREIMAAFNIMSISLESKNNNISEEFKIKSSAGAPWKFTISHKGTPISMANALSAYIGSNAMSEILEESARMQMTDASAAIKEAIIGKPKSISS